MAYITLPFFTCLSLRWHIITHDMTLLYITNYILHLTHCHSLHLLALSSLSYSYFLYFWLSNSLSLCIQYLFNQRLFIYFFPHTFYRSCFFFLFFPCTVDWILVLLLLSPATDTCCCLLHVLQKYRVKVDIFSLSVHFCCALFLILFPSVLLCYYNSFSFCSSVLFSLFHLFYYSCFIYSRLVFSFRLFICCILYCSSLPTSCL